MNKLLILILGSTVLLGGCHTASVRTTVAVPIGVVEHRNVYDRAVVVRHVEGGYRVAPHHDYAVTHTDTRTVRVSPPPVMHQSRVVVVTPPPVIRNTQVVHNTEINVERNKTVVNNREINIERNNRVVNNTEINIERNRVVNNHRRVVEKRPSPSTVSRPDSQGSGSGRSAGTPPPAHTYTSSHESPQYQAQRMEKASQRPDEGRGTPQGRGKSPEKGQQGRHGAEAGAAEGESRGRWRL